MEVLNSPEIQEAIKMMSLAKAKEKGESSPGLISTKALLEEHTLAYSDRGIRQNRFYIEDNILREIERKNQIIGIVVNTRCRQVRQFARISTSDDVPGAKIRLKDLKRSPNAKEKKEMELIEQFFINSGRIDFDGAEEREDTLQDIMVMMCRESLVLDKVAIELRRDLMGNIVDFWLIDGATIKRVYRSGFKGSKNDFDPRTFISDTDLERKIFEARLEMIPEDMSKICFVQEINGRLTAAFTRNDMIFDFMQKRVDIRYRGYGYSPAEQAMNAITAFLCSMAYNTEGFNISAIPKIGLAFKNGTFRTEQLQELQDEWMANFSGIQGTYRIPILNGEVDVLDFMKNARDMEYQKFLEFSACLIAAIYGFDLMEAGLKFFSSGSALNENQDARMKFSKDRGLLDQLSFQSNVFNKIIKAAGWGDKYEFIFTGINPSDKENEQKLRVERVGSFATLNEVRAEEDKPPLKKGGDIVLNSIYLQYLQMQQQIAQMSQGNAGGELDQNNFNNNEDDGEMDDIIDEALDEKGITKAKLKARNFLL